MTRAELEARLWAIAGRELKGSVIDAIVDACEEYASEQAHRPAPPLVPHHVSGTDLYPVIGRLADLLLNNIPADAESAGCTSLSARRAALREAS